MPSLNMVNLVFHDKVKQEKTHLKHLYYNSNPKIFTQEYLQSNFNQPQKIAIGQSGWPMQENLNV